MLPASHLLSGFLVVLLLGRLGAVETTVLNIALALAASLFPDVDGLWSSRLRDHHGSLLHAPVTWILFSALLLVAGYSSAAVIVLSASLFHLAADYATALTTGVKFLYPFRDDEFHFLELSPSKGEFNPRHPSFDELKEFFRLYWKQKPVLLLELLVSLSGFGSLLVLLNAV